MIRQLAQCPYCQSCEVALTDSFEVVLNPDADPPQPCPHLIWIEGRYSQWGVSPLAGRKTKIARMIGSNEFGWQQPALVARDDAEPLQTYLKEMVGAGGGWEFAPSEPHIVRAISASKKSPRPMARSTPAGKSRERRSSPTIRLRSLRVYRRVWSGRVAHGRTYPVSRWSRL